MSRTEIELSAWLNQPNVKLLTAGTYGNSAENMEEFVSHMDWKINYSGSDQFKVVFADESFGLRGVDARSPTLELKLLIFLSFVNSREFYQALMRVGRGGDRCSRVVFG